MTKRTMANDGSWAVVVLAAGFGAAAESQSHLVRSETVLRTKNACRSKVSFGPAPVLVESEELRNSAMQAMRNKVGAESSVIRRAISRLSPELRTRRAFGNNKTSEVTTGVHRS